MIYRHHFCSSISGAGVAQSLGFCVVAVRSLDSQPQVIKLTSCLPMVGGSLRVLRLLPPGKLVAMI